MSSLSEIVADCALRRRGFAPALSDEEVITLEVCGEYLGFDKDEAIFDISSPIIKHGFPSSRDGPALCDKRPTYGKSKR